MPSTFWEGLRRRCPPAASTTCCEPQGLFCNFQVPGPRITLLGAAGATAAATARAGSWAAAGASGAAELCWPAAWRSGWAGRAGGLASRPSRPCLHRRGGGRGPSSLGKIKVRGQHMAQSVYRWPTNTPLSNRSMGEERQPARTQRLHASDVVAEQIRAWAGAGRLQAGGLGGDSADQPCPSETSAEKDPPLLFRLLPGWLPFNSRGRRCGDETRSRPLQFRWLCSSK